MNLYQPTISGSLTVSGSVSVIGPFTMSGGSITGTASFASNSGLLSNLDSGSFVGTGSYNTLSSSFTTVSSSYSAASGSFSTRVSTLETASGSFSGRVTKIEGNYATTGSNIFTGAQTVCANITSTGTIIAQTLNVQQVTSSVVYSSGSNVFGCALINTQQFTGSVTMTGSLAVFTAGTSPEFQVAIGGTTHGNAITDVHQMTGSLRITGSNSLFTVGCVGIGTTTPSYILSTQGTGDNRLYHYNSGNTSGDRSVIQAEVCGDTSGNAFFAAAKTGVAWSFGRNTTTGNFEVRSNFDLANDTQTRFQITSTGISCFRCQVCAPAFVGGTVSGTTGVFSGQVCANSNLTAAGIIYGRTTNNFPTTGAGYYAITTNNFDAERGGITIQVSCATNTLATALTINYLGAATFSSSVTAGDVITANNNGAASSVVQSVMSFADGYRATFRLNNTHTGGNIWELYSTNNCDGVYSGGKFGIRNTTTDKYALTITNGGNVGIGTTSPSAPLDVCQMAGPGTRACDALFLRAGNNSDIFCSNQILFGYNGTTDYAHGIKTRHQSGNACENGIDFFTWKFGDAAGTKAGQYVMTIAGNGNVGIGTCAPASRLDINGGCIRMGEYLNSASSLIGKQRSSTGVFYSSVEFYSTAGDDAIIFNTHCSGVSAGERMRITGGGNVGIGITPSYKLDVQLPSGVNGQIIRLGRSAGAYYWSLGIDSAGSCFNFYNNSNTSVAVIHPTTGVYTATSDCRVKSNITDSCSVLDKILQVKVRQYIWNESCEREDYGLIAQEVNEVLPQYVKQGDENTNWGVSKSEFVPALIKAIQEQQCQIYQLRSCLGIA